MKGAAKALHQTPEGLEKIKKVRELTKLAKEGAGPPSPSFKLL